MRVPEEEPLLGVAEHKQYRTIVGKLMFLTGERPDIQFCVKECARESGEALRLETCEVSKRICRYLMCTRERTLKLEPWNDVDTLHMMVDSDWATNKVDRRSTSACVAQLGFVQFSVTAGHRGHPLCRQRRQKDAKGFLCVLWRENWA